MSQESKQMCLDVLFSLMEKKGVTGQRKAAKVFGITQAKAKDLMGEAKEHTQDEIIKYTAVMIQYIPEG